MMGKWAPPQERGSLLAVAYIGANMGAILGMPLTAFFCDTPGLGWETGFYVFGKHHLLPSRILRNFQMAYDMVGLFTYC